MARRKTPKYRQNPFLEHALQETKTGSKKVCETTKGSFVVFDKNTGVLAESAGLWYSKEVDQTEFVKLYVNGVGAILSLQAAGKKIFALIYAQLHGKEGINKTEITLHNELSPVRQIKLSDTTFYRGIGECVKAGIIAESVAPSLYYINPAFIFNGDRLAVVNEYKVKSSKTVNQDGEIEPPLGEMNTLF